MKQALQDESRQEQLQRVQQMEQALNAAAHALQSLEAALKQYQAALPELQALAEYYESPFWLQDYDADHRGAFPPELRRGVLSQDALYDLLCEHTRLRREMRKLGEPLHDCSSER